MKHTLTRTLGGLIVGLSVALSVQAQPVDGEVKKIDLDAGKITLKHGPIQNLDIPAMQMAFRVANPAWLQKLGGQFTVTAIDVRK